MKNKAEALNIEQCSKNLDSENLEFIFDQWFVVNNHEQRLNRLEKLLKDLLNKIRSEDVKS